ncbi:hypothetical protein [Nocardia terpenica]|uniref:Uncharacterized protein n=1 Tax=Nocardia terpenica TaxID=455432 RepID=A0A164HCM2_9NOCA|nr:hypothetical protein [Nocardia terpenica]KZM68397.1 hypothetical protein AWN90_10950 [Nocardia terpenica]NQE88682.1 hypothetical protein [Nocardia terpenica]
MFDYDTWRIAYDQAMTRLAAVPKAILNETEAKAIPLRWFTDHYGHTIFGGHEHPNLAHWCDNGPYARTIARRWLAVEAHTLLGELRDPLVAELWHELDTTHTHAAAVHAMRAVVLYHDPGAHL